MFFTKNLFAVPLKNVNLNYYCQVLQVSPHRIKGGLLDKGYLSVCNRYHDLLMSMNLSDTAILNIKGSD